MTDDTLQHTQLDGIADYTAALDTLCKLAQHNLYLFEGFRRFGYNSEARYTTLRNPARQPRPPGCSCWPMAPAIYPRCARAC